VNPGARGPAAGVGPPARPPPALKGLARCSAAIRCSSLLAGTTLGPPGVAPGSARATAGLQALADQAESSGAFPSSQVAVVARRRRLWSTARSVADMSTGPPATSTTGYCIASTTKRFVALAATRRAARREVDLQDTLAQRLPQASWRPSLKAVSPQC